MTTYNINNSYLENKINNLLIDTAIEDYWEIFWEVDFGYTVSDIIESKYNYIKHYDFKMYSDIDFTITSAEIDSEEACKLIKNNIPMWLYDFMEEVGIIYSLDFWEGYGCTVISNLLDDLESGWNELFDYVSAYTYLKAINELKNEGIFKGYDNLKKEVIKALHLLEDKVNEDIKNLEYEVEDYLNDTYNYVYSDDFIKDYFELNDDIEIIR